MPAGIRTSPDSQPARSSSRVNQRASAISAPSTSMSVVARDPAEADHQARRQRPRLVAEVGHVAHGDADLLQHLAAYGVLERLPRLDEAGQGRVAALGPDGLVAQQQALVGARRASPWVIGHDHRRVGARELPATAAGALELVAGVPGLQRRAAARDSAGSPSATRPGRRRGRARARRRGRRPAPAAAPAAAPTPPARRGRRRGRPAPRSGSPRRARRAAPGCRRARRAGATQPTSPSTGRSRLPAMTSTRVPGSAHRSSSQASSVRRSPTRLCAWAERARCGRLRWGSASFTTATLLAAASCRRSA